MTIEAIDISSNNNWRRVPTAGVRLLIVKITEGDDYAWDEAPAVVEWGRTWADWVMAYHWVRPDHSAASQANWFADHAEPLHLDGWWLDIEDDKHPIVTSWAVLVPSVFDLVAARLGAEHGGNYKGRYFAPELNGFVAARNWWLSDYRNHPDLSGQVVLDQYTSTGGPGGSPLDRSRVLDEAAFLRMVGTPAPQPNPQPEPEEEDDMLWLVKKAKDPKVYVTDLRLSTRHVQDQPEEKLIIDEVYLRTGKTITVQVMPDWFIDRLVAAAGAGAQH